MKLTRAKWSGPSEFLDLISKRQVYFSFLNSYNVLNYFYFTTLRLTVGMFRFNGGVRCVTAGMAGLVVSVRLPAQVYVTNTATSRPAKFETIMF